MDLVLASLDNTHLHIGTYHLLSGFFELSFPSKLCAVRVLNFTYVNLLTWVYQGNNAV